MKQSFIIVRYCFYSSMVFMVTMLLYGSTVPFADAQYGTGEGTANVETTVNVTGTTQTETEVETKTETTIHVEADVRQDDGEEGARDGSSEETSTREVDKASPKLQKSNAAGTNMEIDEEVIVTSASEVAPLRGNEVSVRATEVRGWDPEKKQEFLETVKTHAEVRSGQDLENFATGVLLRDENVEEVSSDEHSVEVRYRVPARFLGIFKIDIPATVVATKMSAEGSETGRVKVQFPWFRFLYAVPTEVAPTTLERELHAELDTELSTEGELDVAQSASLYQKITVVLKAKYDAARGATNNPQ